MKAAMVTFHLKPGKTSEFLDRVQDMLKRTRETPGIGPVYLISEPGTDACMTFGVWQTEEQAVGWRKNSDFVKFLDEAKPLFSSPPVRKLYDVLLVPEGRAEKRVA